MLSQIRQYKVVGSLPSGADLVKDSIYYVKTGSGFDMYITDITGAVITPLNSQLPNSDFIAMINQETTGVPKGSVVYTTGDGFRLSSALSPLSKKTIGLLTFDTEPGQLGLIQSGNVMSFSEIEWSIATGYLGGVASVNYWLSKTPGKLTLDPPTEEVSSPVWSIKIAQGISQSSIAIEIQQSVKL
jgi:hypothetical protein